MISVHGDPLAKLGYLESGGQNVYVYELSKELGRLGWEVDVYSRLDNKQRKKVITYGKNVRVIRLEAGPKKFVRKYDLFNYLPEFISSFIKYTKKNKLNYGVVHGHYWEGGWVAMQIKRLFNIPLVQTFHSLGYIRYNTLKKFRDQIITDFEKKYRFKIEQEIMNSADVIIATSNYEKQDFVDFYKINGNNVKVIPCGVNLKKFKHTDISEARNKIKFLLEDKIILFVGRLEWRKGIATLFQGIAEFLKVNPLLRDKLKVLIVGGSIGKRGSKLEKEELKRLKDIAKKLNIREKIGFTGNLPQEKLRYYYSAANVCVTPSYYEPFGLIPLEAMSCKIPVIVSDTGGLRYTVKNRKTGLLFPPRQPKILAEKLNLIFTDKNLVEKIVKQARANVKEHFDWRIIARQISDLYKTLINKTNLKKQLL